MAPGTGFGLVLGPVLLQPGHKAPRRTPDPEPPAARSFEIERGALGPPGIHLDWRSTVEGQITIPRVTLDVGVARGIGA